jgi:hypothetical protein
MVTFFAAILLTLLVVASTTTEAFITASFSRSSASSLQRLNMAASEEGVDKAAPIVTGEELEKLLTEWDTPLVVDAYATWSVCFIRSFGCIYANWLLLYCYMDRVRRRARTIVYISSQPLAHHTHIPRCSYPIQKIGAARV